jgi:hypothetical protein
LLVFTGSKQRDRALVLARSRIRVNAFVQLRRDREDKRQEKCGEQSACNGAAAKPRTFDDNLAAHVSGLWFVRANPQGKSFLAFCQRWRSARNLVLVLIGPRTPA